MRKKFLSALLLCCMVLTLLPTAALADGDVAINETNFPDENFRQYVKTKFDTNKDDALSADEIAAVKQILVTNPSITSIEGIEHFTALENLTAEIPNLTTLDVSNNTALTSLRCSHTKLTSLDTSHNKNLSYLECENISTLTKLDVSKNTELKFLHCRDNALTALDLTKNLALEKLECGGNGDEFTTLDLSQNTELKYFGCFGSKLSSLDLTNNTNLEELHFAGNNVSTLDVSKNTNLKKLRVFSNQLTSLDTSKNNNLEVLEVQDNPLTSMYLGDDGPTIPELKFSNRPYPIEVSAATRTFDLSQLPDGFKVDKTSDWQGGTVSGTTLTVNEGVENVTYTYDCGEREAKYGDPEVTGKLVMPCTLKINWKNADGPAAPVLELRTKTPTDILVTENNTWEYSIDNGNKWQSSCHFTNLQPGTQYTIIARVKGTATQNPGAVSEPLIVTTMHIEISPELKEHLRAVASGYEGEYDGKEHAAVNVDMNKMPKGWRIASYTTDLGQNYSDSMPTIKNVGTLRVGVKFVHPDYIANITHFYTAEVTPKPLTNDMIADIPNQLYTGQQIQPKPEIKHGDMDLMEGRDFNYSYGENISPSGTVNITGKGNYEGMASKSFNIVNEITEITEDDLKDLNFPTDLVTVKCTTTNSSKEYGRIPGDFDLSKKPYMENGVWKVIVYLNLSAYQNKYDVDTGKTHEFTGFEGNPHNTFTLKYVNGMWQLDGDFPKVVILVKCDDGHHKPNKPTVPEDTTVPSTAVEVRCTTANDQQQSARRYGLLPGGFTATEPMEKEGKYECLITLNPETYRQKYSEDTGILHSLDDSQPMGDLQIKLVYDRGSGKWMPLLDPPPLTIYVKCDNHQEQYTITFEGNGGTPSDATMTTVNQKLPQLPKATHSGRYSFDGWYTAASGGTMITTDTEFDKNTTVYAHWTYTGSSGGSSSGRTYHTIKASSDSNGSISPSERVSVRHGRDQSFTITPDKGYEIAKVLVDGKSVGAVESYTFKSVTKNHTIEAIFMKVDDNKPMPDTFMDVPKGSYYEKAVDWAVKNGITAGTGDNYFMPDGICTRAQAVTFLWRVAGSPTPKTEVMPFEDVPEGSYYYEAVLWATENEITVGTSATTFSPELTCSRAHIVSFLWRAAGYPSAGTVNPFADVPENAYYINAMLWAVKQEITVGTTPSTFSPDEGCTRAQIVTFLYRARSM